MTQAPAAIALTHTARRTLAFTCCAAMFLYAVYLGAVGVLLPAVGKTFELGTAAQGRLFPASFAGFILVVLIVAPASDRLNRKLTLMFGLGLFALGLVLFGRAPSFAIALAASLLIGGGGGAVGALSSALSADLYPQRRGHMMAAIQVAFGSGAALGPGVGAVLLTHQVSWRMLYAGLAFASFAVLLILQAQPMPAASPTTPRVAAPSLLSLLSQRPVQWLCLIQIFYAGAEVGFFSWMPTYFEKRLPGGADLAGIVITVFWVAMTVGRSLTGKFMGRMPLMRLSALLAVCGAISASLVLVWHDPVVVLLFVVLTGLSFAGIYIFISAYASERYSDSLGAIFGCLAAAGGVGTALIPWGVGAIAATKFGWTSGLSLIPLAALGVAGTSLMLSREP